MLPTVSREGRYVASALMPRSRAVRPIMPPTERTLLLMSACSGPTCQGDLDMIRLRDPPTRAGRLARCRARVEAGREARQAEFDGVVDQAADLEPPVGEAGIEDCAVLIGLWDRAVVPEVRLISASLYSPGVASTCSSSRWNGPIRANPSRCTSRGRAVPDRVGPFRAGLTAAIVRKVPGWLGQRRTAWLGSPTS